jgi:hypothetical protein
MNVYNFILVDEGGDDFTGTIDSDAFAETWSGLFGNLLYPSLSVLLTLNRIDILEVRTIRRVPPVGDPFNYQVIYGLESRWEPAAATGGQQEGHVLPTYVCATVRLGGLTRVYNRRTFGSKRIGGLLESVTGAPQDSNGNYLTDPMFSVMAGYATWLKSTVAIAAGCSMKFGIVNKSTAALTGDDPVPQPIEGFAPVTVAEPNRYVGSQVSRKQSNRPF